MTSWTRRWTKRLVLWIGPAFISLLLVVLGFLAWVVATQAGSRWVVHTAVKQLDGQVSGVRGSIWQGLDVGQLQLQFPGLDLDIDGLRLVFNWKELLSRRLHGREVSAQRLAVRLDPDATQAPDDDEPFSFPALPVQVTLDQLSVGELVFDPGVGQAPVQAAHIDAALSLGDEGAQLVFRDLTVNYDGVHVGATGEGRLLALADPWPLDVHLNLEAHSSNENRLLCLQEYVPSLPAAPDGAAEHLPQEPQPPALSKGLGWPGLAEIERRYKLWRGHDSSAGATETEQHITHPDEAALCTLQLSATAQGSLDDLILAAQGGGQGISLDFKADLRPRTRFLVQEADLKLQLPDGSSLAGTVQQSPQTAHEGQSLDRLHAHLAAHSLNLALLGMPDLPPSTVTAALDLNLLIRNQQDLLSAGLQLDIDPATHWNELRTEGQLKARVYSQAQSGLLALPAAGDAAGAAVHAAPWESLLIDDLALNLQVGGDHVKLNGDLGTESSQLDMDVAIARLAALWPDLPAAAVTLEGRLKGSLQAHQVQLEGHYQPAEAEATELGEAPVNLSLALAGGWKTLPGPQGLEGWQGNVSVLQVKHAGLQLGLLSPLPVQLSPEAASPEWQWQLGQTQLEVTLPSGAATRLNNQQARGGHGRWQTRGSIDHLVISQAVIAEVQELIGASADDEEDRGRIILSNQEQDEVELIHQVNWDLAFDGALQGNARVARVSGDVMVPGDPPFPLGLKTFALDVAAKPVTGSSSQLTARLDVETEKMGRLDAVGTALLHATPDGGFALNDQDTKSVQVNADISDLSWLSLVAGDEMEFGGSLKAAVQARSRSNGSWASGGTITGQNIRLVRVDDGIRLLDGELAAHFDNDRVILDRLYFPARLRITPKEWRTAQWVKENPEAQDGGLTITGSWNLLTSDGKVDVEFYRYPLLQRTDRYAMVSGNIAVSVPYPQVSISGQLKMDAGWVDLDMLSSVPTLDSDVVVLRPGQKNDAEHESPLDISVDLAVDLGPRFYITGFGLDSGLVGDLRITMHDGDLRGVGILRTRGGAIEAYGQRLQLRQGSITFQGDLTNPVLHIEALRTGLQVEAGVVVLGTARKPRIDLISYPDVSDVQKLSWLLLGRGPEDSGGDAMLLFSVGTSFLSDGEPFYRKFGIDELSLQSGELGSTGSILPAESVVSGLSTGTSIAEQQFVLASKTLARGFTVSIEQALSDAGTVGRVSYRLMRGLTAELSVGTVNGLALIYRRLFW